MTHARAAAPALTPEGCTFSELFEVSGLQQIDERFLKQLHARA